MLIIQMTSCILQQQRNPMDHFLNEVVFPLFEVFTALVFDKELFFLPEEN